MDDTTGQLPAAHDVQQRDLTKLVGGEMSLGMKIMLNTDLYERCKDIARHMAAASGFVPAHLVGKTAACFAVVTRALTWRLDPYAVASSTYETPGGRIGYEGRLVQAILENSGRLEGGIDYRHYGDWSKVMGKWVLATSQRGKDYTKATWTRDDAKGLGVTVIAKVRGEPEPREWDVDLEQAMGSLNSTLWATDPKTQLCYFAARRFANVRMPGVLMGIPFDFDGEVPPMRDVTPERAPRTRPKARDLDEFADRRGAATVEAEAAGGDDMHDETGAQDVEADPGPQPDEAEAVVMVRLVVPGNPLAGVEAPEAAALERLLSLISTAPSPAYVKEAVAANPWAHELPGFLDRVEAKAQAMAAARARKP